MADAETCVYVNPKQYNRILKRRQQRQRLEAAGKLLHVRPKQLGRQAWAIERERLPDGTFARGQKDSSENSKVANSADV